MLGILLIDKPKGITSHDAVDHVRRRMRTRRVGHAGTLDPMATGLLVMAVGPATRFLQYLPLEPKEYEGEITLGQSSTTFDTEGELSAELPIPYDLEPRIAEIEAKLKGLIQQLPPLYSAVKVAGKPLYAYARKGEEAPRQPRSVFIEKLKLSVFSERVLGISVVCSGGTYVRTLADDIGQDLGCGAHLSALRRTRAGAFSVEDAVSLDDAASDALIPLARALPPMPLIELNDFETSAIRQGQRVGIRKPPGHDKVGLLDSNGTVVGVARVSGHELQPECVLPLEAMHD